MKDVDLQRVHDTNDEGLRRLTHEHLKVFAKFTSDGCPICEQLAPHFSRHANDEEFRNILFLRLNADENPVAQKIMQQQSAPFFVSYCQGQLLECDMLVTEQEVWDMLCRLRKYQPLAS